MKAKISRCAVRVFASATLLVLLTASATRAQRRSPELFTYDESVQLYENKDLPEGLRVRTLKTLNDGPRDRISDHAPLMVDLPLDEPRLIRPKRTRSEKNLKVSLKENWHE